MRIIDTSVTTPEQMSAWEREQCYNGLDVCITAEVLDVLLPQLDNYTRATYEFSKALQAPVLEMKLRGVLIDQVRKAEVLDELHSALEILDRNLERIVLEGIGLSSFNWRSNADLHRLFYDRLRIPVITRGGRPTVNREALERMESYLIARPIVAHLVAMRDIGKKIGVLRTEIDPDGCIRTSYNIAGTNTGRFSSSLSEFGTGGNLQNIEESLRSIFSARKGMKMAKFDAKQIQSRVVGGIEWNLFQDGRYLDACESFDLHTFAAKLCWPNLPWTSSPEQDLAIAEQKFYRHFSYRDLTKRMGHGTNFGGMPPTISQQTRIPIDLVTQFQPRYFKAFPAHKRWHSWVERELAMTGTIIAITGRKRHFWGRKNSDETKREAIAYDPQSSESHIVGKGMLNIWRAQEAFLLLHEHDALVVEYPEEREDEIIPKLLKQLEVEVPLEHGRTMVVPYDANVGWNRGKYDATKNPDGLRTWKGGDERKRTPQVSLMDRIVHSIHGQSRRA